MTHLQVKIIEKQAVGVQSGAFDPRQYILKAVSAIYDLLFKKLFWPSVIVS